MYFNYGFVVVLQTFHRETEVVFTSQITLRVENLHNSNKDVTNAINYPIQLIQLYNYYYSM